MRKRRLVISIGITERKKEHTVGARLHAVPSTAAARQHAQERPRTWSRRCATFIVSSSSLSQLTERFNTMLTTSPLHFPACQPWRPLPRPQGSRRACQAPRHQVQAVSVLPFIGGSTGGDEAAAADDNGAVAAARPPSSSSTIPSEEAAELRSQVEELKQRQAGSQKCARLAVGRL